MFIELLAISMADRRGQRRERRGKWKRRDRVERGAKGESRTKENTRITGANSCFLGRAFSLRLLAGDSRGRRALILALPVQQALR